MLHQPDAPRGGPRQIDNTALGIDERPAVIDGDVHLLAGLEVRHQRLRPQR
jgi:hypothetical protein